MADLKPPKSEFVEDYGILGEVGEVADLLKKVYFQNHELNVEKLTSELGDCFWYCATSEEFKFDFIDTTVMSAEEMKDSIQTVRLKLDDPPSDEFNFLYRKMYRNIQFCRETINASNVSERFGFLTSLCLHNGIDPFDAMRANVEKLRKRYGEKFDPEKSINRIDK
jgi:NTP pyrophosphatase (non-canonical NTP hydrolase)